MNRKKIISVILTLLLLLACVTACQAASPGQTTEPGDVILYQGNQITIYYDTNTWSFTRLGKVQGMSLLAQPAMYEHVYSGRSGVEITVLSSFAVLHKAESPSYNRKYSAQLSEITTYISETTGV